MAARRTGASVTVGPHGRILALSAAWFSDGARRRREARRDARCVECGRGLASRRTPYCSRRCQWKFHGHYFWDSARSYAMLRDRYTCQICGVRRRARELDVDHIVEIARGGAALEYSNLQTVCRACHRAKTEAFRLERQRAGAVPPATDAASASIENGIPVPVR
ncbi:MAG TPA: HNH endonuclease signature motif containing protein [Thermoplasmata archaeon]|nr:HNH endonuclease signature motif containing protein [Thermoplasmata archaeon]